MKRSAITAALLALSITLPLAACGRSDQTDSAASSASSGMADAAKEVQQKTSPSFIAEQVQKGIDQAKRELVTQDIDISNVHVNVGDDHDEPHDQGNRPKAVITPQGDLVIAGKTVSATPEQHTMLLDYRQQIIGVAEAGMDIGASGAAIGTQAAKEAIWGALTGKSDKDIEARIKPQTEQIKAAALKLCGRMPEMLASQQKLAASMPEFRPYATMTQKDVDDCGKDIHDDDSDND